MGCCEERENNFRMFNKEDLQKIKSLFKELKSLEEETKHEKYISFNQFISYWKENQYLAKKIYEYTQIQFKNNKINKKIFINTALLLLTGSNEQITKEEHNLSQFQILSLILLSKDISKESYDETILNFENSCLIIESILHCYFINQEQCFAYEENNIKQLAQNISAQFFQSQNSKISLSQYINGINQQFPLIQKFLTYYLTAKFLGLFFKIRIHFPKDPKILPQQFIYPLFLTDQLISNTKKIYSLYSADSSQLIGNYIIAKTLIEFHGPTLLVLDCYIENQHNLFAIFSQSNCNVVTINFLDWKLSQNRQGNIHSFLAFLYPKFKIYYLKNKNSYPFFLNAKENTAFWNKKNKLGLGIGGKQIELEFRIWLDNEFQNCYYCNYDEIFHFDGDPSPEHKYLQVNGIEIFGFSQNSDKINPFELQEIENHVKKIINTKPKVIKLEKQQNKENEFIKPTVAEQKYNIDQLIQENYYRVSQQKLQEEQPKSQISDDYSQINKRSQSLKLSNPQFKSSLLKNESNLDKQIDLIYEKYKQKDQDDQVHQQKQ